MASIDDIMGDLGLFGGSGFGGGALGGMFEAALKMLYRSVAAGAMAYLGLGGQVGPIIDGLLGDSYFTGGFNPSAPPPLLTVDTRADYASERHDAGMDAIKNVADTTAKVVGQMKQSGQTADAIEAALADPVGTIHAIQNAGAASLLTYGAVERNTTVEAARLDLELRREEERQNARDQAVQQADAFFPETGDGRIVADTITFDPLRGN